jgi:hypothetical protein
LIKSFKWQASSECLNTSWFGNLWEARRRIAAWRAEYNYERPQSRLNYRAPRARSGVYCKPNRDRVF